MERTDEDRSTVGGRKGCNSGSVLISRINNESSFTEMGTDDPSESKEASSTMDEERGDLDEDLDMDELLESAYREYEDEQEKKKIKEVQDLEIERKKDRERRLVDDDQLRKKEELDNKKKEQLKEAMRQQMKEAEDTMRRIKDERMKRQMEKEQTEREQWQVELIEMEREQRRMDLIEIEEMEREQRIKEERKREEIMIDDEEYLEMKKHKRKIQTSQPLLLKGMMDQDLFRNQLEFPNDSFNLRYQIIDSLKNTDIDPLTLPKIKNLRMKESIMTQEIQKPILIDKIKTNEMNKQITEVIDQSAIEKMSKEYEKIKISNLTSLTVDLAEDNKLEWFTNALFSSMFSNLSVIDIFESDEYQTILKKIEQEKVSKCVLDSSMKSIDLLDTLYQHSINMKPITLSHLSTVKEALLAFGMDQEDSIDINKEESQETWMRTILGYFNKGLSAIYRIVNGGEHEIAENMGAYQTNVLNNYEIVDLVVSYTHAEKRLMLNIMRHSHSVFAIRLFSSTARQHKYDWKWLFSKIRMPDIEGCFFLDSDFVPIHDDTDLHDIFRVDKDDPEKVQYEIYAVPYVRANSKKKITKPEDFHLFRFQDEDSGVFGMFFNETNKLTPKLESEIINLIYQKMMARSTDWDISIEWNVRPSDQDEDQAIDITRCLKFARNKLGSKGQVIQNNCCSFSQVLKEMMPTPPARFIKDLPSTDGYHDKIKLDFAECTETVESLKKILKRRIPEVLIVQTKREELENAHRFLLQALDLEKIFPPPTKQFFKLPRYRIRSIIVQRTQNKYETLVNVEGFEGFEYGGKYTMLSNCSGRVLSDTREWYNKICAVAYELSSSATVE